MIFYGYARSSATYRVRIALALKKLEFESASKHLLRDEHRHKDYLELNPQGFVPALGVYSGEVLTQSAAIIEYLDEVYPDPPLLPADPVARARVRALVQLIACDVHPLNNLRVLRYLEHVLGQDQGARETWYRHWITTGFEALERLLVRSAAHGRFCEGDAPGMADIFLVPQVLNARRYSTDLSAFPRIVAIDAACLALPAFAPAPPEA